MSKNVRSHILMIFSGFIFLYVRNRFFPQVEIKLILPIFLYIWILFKRKGKWWYYAFEITMAILAIGIFYVPRLDTQYLMMIGFLALISIYAVLLIYTDIQSRFFAASNSDSDVDNG